MRRCSWRSFAPATRLVSPRPTAEPCWRSCGGRLSDDEIAALARDLVARGELKLDIDDFGAVMTRISDKPPTAADLERVQRRLGGDWLAG
jgi:hypothetical protein